MTSLRTSNDASQPSRSLSSNRTGFLLIVVLFLASPANAADDKQAPVQSSKTEFKLVIDLYTVDKKPVVTADLIVYKGVAFHFVKEVPSEIVIIDPGKARIVLLDLKRKIQTELSVRRLDANLATLHARISATAQKQEQAGTRADRSAASLSRDLITPRFKSTYDPKNHSLTLTNTSVEVHASGVPEPNSARLAAILNSLAAIAKLGVLRDPESLPPFTRLDTLRTLVGEHHLRPTEASFLYRLAGPPRKLRWTYQLVPKLTDRERDALERINRIRAMTPFAPYEQYELAEED